MFLLNNAVTKCIHKICLVLTVDGLIFSRITLSQLNAKLVVFINEFSLVFNHYYLFFRILRYDYNLKSQ